MLIQRSLRQGAANIEYILVGGMAVLALLVATQALGERVREIMTAVSTPIANTNGER